MPELSTQGDVIKAAYDETSFAADAVLGRRKNTGAGVLQALSGEDIRDLVGIFSTTARGLVPSTGTASGTKFLADDVSWKTPTIAAVAPTEAIVSTDVDTTVTSIPGVGLIIDYTGTLTQLRTVDVDAAALPSGSIALPLTVLNNTSGGFSINLDDQNPTTVTTIAPGWGARVSVSNSGVKLVALYPITAGALAALSVVTNATLDKTAITGQDVITELASGSAFLVSDADDNDLLKEITYASLLAELNVDLTFGGGETFDEVDDVGDYSSTAFEIGTDGAEQNEWTRFTTDDAHLVNFPAGLGENAYGVIQVTEAAGTAGAAIHSAASITVNGVADRGGVGAALTIHGTVYWRRADDGTIEVFGDIGQATKAFANHDMADNDILNIGENSTFETPSSTLTALGVTAAAQTVLDDTTVAAMLATMGGLAKTSDTLTDGKITQDTVAGAKTIVAADSGQSQVYTGAGHTWTFTGSGLGAGCAGVIHNVGSGAITVSTDLTEVFRGTEPIPAGASATWETTATQLILCVTE